MTRATGGWSSKTFDRLMGLKTVRAVTVQSCDESSGAVRPGLVLSFYVFDDEAVDYLPDEPQLRKMAEFLREQFEAYRAAAADSGGRVYGAGPQGLHRHARSVLGGSRSDFPPARRPGGDDPAPPPGSVDLHVLAATTSLEFTPPRDPAPALPPPLERTLIPSGYRVNDGSYTGQFAGTPGVPVLQNAPGFSSTLPQGWPKRASLKMRERLPKSVSTFRRSIGYGVPTGDGREALGVFRGIRSSEARPFTYDDLIMLREMADTCAADFYFWRDWFEHVNRPHHAVGTTERLFVPVPRSHNRPAQVLTREVLVDVHDLVRDRLVDSVLQVAVVVEHLEAVCNPLKVYAYHSELSETAPRSGTRFSPEELRVTGLTWTELLDRGAPVTFRLPSCDDKAVGILAGARVPFWAWCGRHVQRGVLTVHLTSPKELGPDLVEDLHVAARKIAAILSDAGSTMDRTEPLSVADPQEFLDHVIEYLGASSAWLRLAPGGDRISTWAGGKPMPPEAVEPDLDDDGPWFVPAVLCNGGLTVDRDAERWGVHEGQCGGYDLLRISLRLGSDIVGELVAAWHADPEAANRSEGHAAVLRSRRTRDLIALWSVWSWDLRELALLRVQFQRHENPERVVTWGTSVEIRPATKQVVPAIPW